MNKILIADGGATSVNWALLDKDNIKKFNTSGLNPYTSSSEDIRQTIKKELSPEIRNQSICKVFFYGAGCSTPTKKEILKEALKLSTSKNADISIEHDLLGAARGLLQKKKGLACILGTGSNSCLYDGNKTIRSSISLGFVLGDEGSGAYMGKKILRSYLLGYLPEHLTKAFSKKHPYSLEYFLDQIYRQDKPNSYLASFSHFLSENIHDEWICKFIEACFQDFFDTQIKAFGGNIKTISATGSIAAVFKTQFKNVCKTNKYEIAAISASPLDGLIAFHKEFL